MLIVVMENLNQRAKGIASSMQKSNEPDSVSRDLKANGLSAVKAA
jgi:hypothetical protein